jgi:hypothetical protein
MSSRLFETRLWEMGEGNRLKGLGEPFDYGGE